MNFISITREGGSVNSIIFNPRAAFLRLMTNQLTLGYYITHLRRYCFSPFRIVASSPFFAPSALRLQVSSSLRLLVFSSPCSLLLALCNRRCTVNSVSNDRRAALVIFDTSIQGCRSFHSLTLGYYITHLRRYCFSPIRKVAPSPFFAPSALRLQVSFSLSLFFSLP